MCTLFIITSVFIKHLDRTHYIYRIACNFRGANIRGFRGWRSDHEYFTHE